MAKLIYSMGVSLDGYIEDPEGSFAFAAPAEDVHRLANEQAREAQAFLFGRRTYELMEGYWTDAAAGRQEIDEVEAEFARAYVATPRIVFSDSLRSVPEGTRLVRRSEAREEVVRLKERPGGHLDIGGAALAASLVDLIDEFRMWIGPTAVGGGKPFFGPGRLDLALAEARTMSGGVLWVRYERRRA
jgi:dihydrofolate reductase